MTGNGRRKIRRPWAWLRASLSILLACGLLTSCGQRSGGGRAQTCQRRGKGGLLLGPARGGASPFLRGDTNASGRLDIADAVRTFGYLFSESPKTLECHDAADSNDSGAIDIADGIYSLNYLFASGPAPPPPLSECGADPTGDALDCESFKICAQPGECLTAADLEEIARHHLPGEICLAPGEFGISGVLSAEACPEAAPSGCPGLGVPGCAIDLAAVDCELDRSSSRIEIHVEGSVTDFPLAIEGYGLEALCRIDAVFAVDARLPLILAPAPEGRLVIYDILEPQILDVAVSLEVNGGLLCDVFAALREQFIAAKRQEVSETAKGRLEELRLAYVGARICPRR